MLSPPVISTTRAPALAATDAVVVVSAVEVTVSAGDPVVEVAATGLSFGAQPDVTSAISPDAKKMRRFIIRNYPQPPAERNHGEQKPVQLMQNQAPLIGASSDRQRSAKSHGLWLEMR